MTTSLIITTYNNKEFLELSLLSIQKQSQLPNEIIIADDGSSDGTKELLERYQKIFTIPLLHSWQEDQGFRAAASRNRAIAQAKGEYIILIDGDMLLHQDFIKEHCIHAKKSTFIQGARILLSSSLSQQILKEKEIPSLSFYSSNIQNRINAIHSNLLSKLLSHTGRSHKGIKTCNMSFYRSDCISVNGFNEDFIGWGREDSEFVARLYHKGISRFTLKCQALAYHLWHQENSREMLKENDKILEHTLQNTLMWCENGIDKYL